MQKRNKTILRYSALDTESPATPPLPHPSTRQFPAFGRVRGCQARNYAAIIRNTAVCIVLLCSISCLTAQNTGYMGKRVIVNMGTEFSPAWKRPNFANNPNFHYKWYSFNYILSPGIEIIVHKRGTVGAVYHYLNTKYNTPMTKEGGLWVFFMPDATGKISDSIYLDKPFVDNLTAHGFGIFYKQYMKYADGRAPAGPYIKLQFDAFFFKCPDTYFNDRFNKLSDKGLAFVMVPDQLFAAKIEIGNDFLLFNRLRLSTGFSFGLPFGGFKGLYYDNELFDMLKTGSEHVPINEYARSRILGAYWLGFTVNIGFLAL